jgi:DNA-binding response OmpR family regulator
MDGIEAIEYIREIPHGTATPLIAVSASAMEEEKQRVLEIGANGFLRKPVDEEELLEMLHRHLGVEYQYREEKSGKKTKENKLPGPEDLKNLPEEILEKLRKTIISGDFMQLKQLIDEIIPYDENIVTALKNLADNFDQNGLLYLLG